MRLSLEIMQALGPSLCWRRGPHFTLRYARGVEPGRGLRTRQRYRMERPGTCELPCASTRLSRIRVPGTDKDLARAEEDASPRTGAKPGGQRVEPGREAISGPVEDMGSRSALEVPTRTGNSAREDPEEGRGASRLQSRAWETRRAP